MNDEDARVAAVSEVPSDSTLLATVRTDDGDLAEVLFTRLADDAVVAFRNHCQHWTDVPIDRGEGALMRDGELVCRKHGATFERDTGHCTFGPCEGATLDEVDVTVEEGAVYLTDGDYTLEHLGPGDLERDPGSSDSSRIGF